MQAAFSHAVIPGPDGEICPDDDAGYGLGLIWAREPGAGCKPSFPTQCSLGLMAGFALMMTLDTALG